MTFRIYVLQIYKNGQQCKILFLTSHTLYILVALKAQNCHTGHSIDGNGI